MAPVLIVVPPNGKASSTLLPEVICWPLESVCFAFLISEKCPQWKAVIQASEFVTYIHHWLNLNDKKVKLGNMYLT